MYPDPIISLGNGGFGLTLYDVMLALALVVAMLLCDKMTQKRGFSIELQKLVIVGILFCVTLGFGSAVLFQAFYNFLDTGVFEIALNTGATFYGGLLGGAGVFLLVWFVGGKFYLKGENKGEEKRRFKDMLDIAACCVPLAHAIGRLGCLFAGCCHGAVTDAWYGVYVRFASNLLIKVVPIPLFESIFLFILSGVLIWLFYKKPNVLPLMPTYCGVYGIWRFIIEFFRNDDRGATIVSWLTPSQLVAVLLTLFAIVYFVLWFLNKSKKKEEPKNVEEEI